MPLVLLNVSWVEEVCGSLSRRASGQHALCHDQLAQKLVAFAGVEPQVCQRRRIELVIANCARAPVSTTSRHASEIWIANALLLVPQETESGKHVESMQMSLFVKQMNSTMIGIPRKRRMTAMWISNVPVNYGSHDLASSVDQQRQ